MDEENIGLENLDRERETERANEEEEETSFTDDNDESVLIIDGSNPDFTRVDDDVRRKNEEMREADKNLGRGIGNIKTSITTGIKRHLREELGVTFNKKDGPSSTLIYDKLKFKVNEKNGKVTSATYDGKELLVLRNGKLDYSKRTSESFVNEFKELLRKAVVEHQKTPALIAEKRAGVDLPQNVMDNVIENVGDQIDSEIDRRLEEISSSTEITANELSELRGTLYAKEGGEERIKALGIEMDHWKKESDKAKAEGAEGKALLYDAMSKAAKLKADKIRLKLNQKPVSEEVQSMIEEETGVNDLTRLERFKKWARENIVGVSVIAISVAGIVTSHYYRYQPLWVRGIR